MNQAVQASVMIVTCGCALAVSISDFALRRARRPDVSVSQMGMAPFRWYREESFRPESVWLARVARRACTTMFILFGLLLVFEA